VRALPTHALMYDVDAERPAVARWLAAHGYAQNPAGGYFHQLHGADAHSDAQREPARVHVYEHACWAALVSEDG